MPAFSPKIGTSNVTPHEPWWRRWYKKYKTYILSGLTVAVVVAIGWVGWWVWQGQYAPASGGSVAEGLVGQPSRLNPLFSSDNLVDSQLTPLIFRGLLTHNDKQELIGDLASSWQRSEDGKSYDIHLGDHDWQDGQPVTAQDVAFTIGLAQDDSYHGAWSKSFTDVKVNVLDAHHLKLELKDPFAPFDQTLTMGILPQHLLGGKSIDQIAADPFNLKPVGSGKLKFLTLTQDPQTKKFSQMQFKPVDGYLDSIDFDFYDSNEALVTDFKLGKIQLLGGAYDPVFDSLKNFPDKHQKSPLLKSQTYGLFFNLHNQSVADPGVRAALAYAVPKNKLISDIFHNQVVVLNGVYQPDHWAYSSRAETYSFSPDKSKEAWDDIQNKPTSIRLLVPDKPIYQQLASSVGQAWQELGIKVTVITRSNAEMSSVVNAHQDYDVVLLGEQSDVDPDRYSTWHSTQMPPAGLNIAGENNKRVDKSLEDGRKDLTIDARKHDYDNFQYYLAKDAPVIWLYQPKFIYIWSNKVKGVSLPGAIQDTQDRFNNVKDWYVKTQRQD